MDLVTLAGHSKTIVSITILDSTVFGLVQLSELKKLRSNAAVTRVPARGRMSCTPSGRLESAVAGFIYFSST